MKRVVHAAAVLAASVVLAACGPSSHSAAPNSATPTATSSRAATTTVPPIVTGPAGTLVIFADDSLRAAFPGLGAKFEAAHPGVKVNFIFAGSTDLAQQLAQGGYADAFAAADIPDMQRAIDANKITEAPQEFGKNTLTIVTAPGNPKHIARLADLANAGVTVAVCGAATPCGAVTKRAESDTGLDLSRAAEQPTAADVVARVTAGQADAGLVYVTDAKAAGATVTEVTFRNAARDVDLDPIAVLAGSKEPVLAHAFETLVTGPDGQAALSAAGFGAAH